MEIEYFLTTRQPFSLFMVIDEKREIVNYEKIDLKHVVYIPNTIEIGILFTKLDKQFEDYKTKFLSNKSYHKLPEYTFIRLDIPDVRELPTSKFCDSVKYIQNVLLPSVKNINFERSFREEFVDREWKKIKNSPKEFEENMYQLNVRSIIKYKNIPEVTEQQILNEIMDENKIKHRVFLKPNNEIIRALGKTLYYQLHIRKVTNIKKNTKVNPLDIVLAYLSGEKILGEQIHAIYYAQNAKQIDPWVEDKAIDDIYILSLIFNFLKQNPHEIEDYDYDFKRQIDRLLPDISDKNLVEVLNAYFSLIRGNEVAYRNPRYWNKMFLKAIQGVLKIFEKLPIKHSLDWKERFEDLRNNFQYLEAQEGFNQEAMYLKFRELENRFGYQLINSRLEIEFLNHYSCLQTLDHTIENIRSGFLSINNVDHKTLKIEKKPLLWQKIKESFESFLTTKNAIFFSFIVDTVLMNYNPEVVDSLCSQLQKELGLGEAVSIIFHNREDGTINFIISNLTSNKKEILPYTGIITAEKLFFKIAKEKHFCLSHEYSKSKKIGENLENYLQQAKQVPPPDTKQLKIK